MQGCPLELTETKYLLEFVGPLRHQVKFRLHEAHRSSWLSISLTLKHLRTSSVISSEMRKQWEVVLLLQTEHFTTQVSQKSNYCMGFKIDFICNIRHANKFPAKRRAWHFMCAQSFFHFHAAVQKNRPPSLSCLCGTLVGQAEEMENLTTALGSEVFEEEVLDIAQVHCECEL